MLKPDPDQALGKKEEDPYVHIYYFQEMPIY